MLAVTTAVYGRVSDLVGVRLPLVFGITLMTVGAIAAALAPTFEVLLVARLFQVRAPRRCRPWASRR